MWTCETDPCSASEDRRKIIGICQVWAVVSGLGREQTHTRIPASFGALKYDVRHAALVEASKNEIKREQNEGEKVRRTRN